MVWFGQRKKLAARYRYWLSKHPEVLDCPETVIAFLASRVLMDGDEVVRYLATNEDTEEEE